jgi:hypothetical protein
MTLPLARMVGALTLGLVLPLGVPPPAAGQVVATSFEELRFKVGPGDTIYITPQTGGEFSAEVVEVSAATLAVAVGGQRRALTEPDVKRIRQRLPDSLWMGTLIGFGIGAALGGVSASFSETCSYEGGAACVGPAIGMGLMGAGVGAGVDALIKGRKVIYEAPAARSADWNLSPAISGRAAGARVTLRF